MLYEITAAQVFGKDQCFLCGDNLSRTNRSDEHVIPRWAQERYQLWDQKLILLNRTAIPYRQLTIPCCGSCNNGALQPIETAISQAVLRGTKAVEALEPRMIFIWLGKIFYGLLYRELFLSIDRSNPHSGTITSPEILERFRMHHLFLQSARVPMKFVTAFPASILIYETKPTPDPRHQWDVHDNFGMFISVRVGQVGMIAILQDGGAQSSLMEELKKEIILYPLHPIQHLELSAMMSYQGSLMNRVPKYVVMDGMPINVMQSPLGGFSRKPIFDEWDDESYARFLAAFTGLSIQDIFEPNRGVLTWLRNPDGSPKNLSFEELPWPIPRRTYSPDT